MYNYDITKMVWNNNSLVIWNSEYFALIPTNWWGDCELMEILKQFMNVRANAFALSLLSGYW